jgi:hypothetical protein
MTFLWACITYGRDEICVQNVSMQTHGRRRDFVGGEGRTERHIKTAVKK